MKGKNKLVPRLLGITKKSIVRVDENTKEVGVLLDVAYSFCGFAVMCQCVNRIDCGMSCLEAGKLNCFFKNLIVHELISF